MPTTFSASASSVVDTLDFTGFTASPAPAELLTIRQGEKILIDGWEALTGKTLTILGGVTATLYQRRIAISGYTTLEVVDVLAGPAAKVIVVYNLDTSGLAAGFYTLVFTFTASGSDGEDRVFKPARNLRVLAAGAPD